MCGVREHGALVKDTSTPTPAVPAVVVVVIIILALIQSLPVATKQVMMHHVFSFCCVHVHVCLCEHHHLLRSVSPHPARIYRRKSFPKPTNQSSLGLLWLVVV